GIDRAHVLLFNVFGEGLDTGTVMSKNQRRVEVQQRIAAIPGVRAATLSVLGGFAAGGTAPVIIEDRPPVLDPLRAWEKRVTASSFETLGLPIVRGRTWSAEVDLVAPTPSPVVVNQALSRLLFADGDPIGRRIRCSGTSFEIVGVVRDARYLNIR